MLIGTENPEDFWRHLPSPFLLLLRNVDAEVDKSAKLSHIHHVTRADLLQDFTFQTAKALLDFLMVAQVFDALELGKGHGGGCVTLVFSEEELFEVVERSEVKTLFLHFLDQVDSAHFFPVGSSLTLLYQVSDVFSCRD